ncbi:putative swr1p complex component protein [Neofusicoccum parvum UCRNP2]|uniref:SWR1-complex protein 5 n=1 Tax=Botryosphaeria parva (strain UCR-NP2) TaxID=1287680 RepID=R1EIA0_BOTPV|nr:putative swr1p complex component protein [Neofusicoccum parvum UCRNP2]
MADPLSLLQDDDYNSASDEEFDPTAAAAAADDDDDAASTSDDEEPRATKPRKPAKGGKRKRDVDDAELDSGDEATIAAARRRGNKKQRQADGEDDDVPLLSDEEGGEGGLVKTRAQRRLEQKERRPLARVDGATADVDAIWAALSTAPVGRSAKEEQERATRDEDMAAEERGAAAPPPPAEEVEEEMITIKRTYDFAGDRITEERQVPKASAEARLYLAQQQEKLEKQAAAKKTPGSSATPDTAEGGGSTPAADGKALPEEEQQPADKPFVRRPLRRPTRFESNPTAEVRTLPPEKQLTWARRRALLDPTAATPLTAPANAADNEAQAANASILVANKNKEKAQKLNTVDKSRLDWAGYVDKEGIADELDEYGRAKEGYLGRMDFLNRVDQRRDEERRAAKAAVQM